MFSCSQFKGIAPKIAAHLLPEGMAQVATDCRLYSGKIKPLRDLSVASGISVVAGAKSFFPYSSSVWLSAAERTDYARSPIANDSWDRLYATKNEPGGADYPVMRTNEGSTWYRLGIPAPTAAPTIAKSGTPTSEDEIDMETWVFVYTYVSAYGEEGPPSPPASIDVYPGETANLSALQTGPAGAYNLSAKNIYRLNRGSDGSDYQLSGTVDLAVTAYDDSTPSADLSLTLLVSTEWDMPPTALTGLRVHPAGFLVGFVAEGRDLCFSMPYLPHAWPTSYRIPFKEKIVAVEIFGTSILVLTEGAPHVVTGADPEAMSDEQIEHGEACIERNAVVDMGEVVIYPTSSGLMAIGVGFGPKLITEAMMSRDEWSPYTTTMQAWQDGNNYILFCASPATGIYGLILDFANQTVTTHGITGTCLAGYYDSAGGRLLLHQNTADTGVKQWDGGTERSWIWKSRKLRMPEPGNVSCAIVLAEDYDDGGSVDLTAKIYADGVLKHTQSVGSGEFFWLPSGFVARDWEFEVVGNVTVTAIALAMAPQDLLK